jgi:anti-sigma regulatory factor (Ser/Thr protein kinase)
MTSDPSAIATAQDVEWFTVDHQSAVGGARRAANALALRLGFGEARSAEVALVVSELAGNQLKHAGSGVVVLRTRRSGWDDVAVEVLASDRGPGMRDVTSAMQDGVSSSGTLGIGLGTIPRLASAWDVYSAPGDGTVVAAVFGPNRQNVPWTAGPTGIARAMTGQSMCGDAFALRSPTSLLGIVHRALAGTRGAAVSIAQPVGDQIRYAGLGNVTAFQRGSGRSRGLMGHPGIAGSGTPKIRESVYPSEGPGVLVLHSDGLTERMHLDTHPGLLSRAPLIVAAVLLRDYGVRRDDASVLVVPLGPQLATSGTGPGLAESRS